MSETNQTDGREISFTRHKSLIQSIRAFYCCIPCIVVIDAEKVDRSWSTLLCLEGKECRYWTRSPKRSSGSARRSGVSMHNARNSPASSANWKRPNACSRATARARRREKATRAAPAPGRGRRTTTARPAGGKRGSSSLSDQVLALATGKTQREVGAGCKGARPNHVGAAIARHKRAGRIEERDRKLYATQSTGTEQRAAV